METGQITAVPEVVEISPKEGRKMVGAQVRDRLGIDLDEFLARVDGGYYADTDDDQVIRLVMLVPFAR